MHNAHTSSLLQVYSVKQEKSNSVMHHQILANSAQIHAAKYLSSAYIFQFISSMCTTRMSEHLEIAALSERHNFPLISDESLLTQKNTLLSSFSVNKNMGMISKFRVLVVMIWVTI